MFNSVLTIDFDDLKISELEEQPIEMMDFAENPLPLVCEFYKKNVEPYSIYDRLQTLELDKVFVENEYHQYADEMCKHFKNKILLRRLKSEHISPWMTKVESILENPLSIPKDNMRILVTLPKFYEENLQLDDLMSKHKSFEAGKTYTFNSHYRCDFVKKISRHSSKDAFVDYYWRTEDNMLLRVRTKLNDYSSCAWETLSKQKSLIFTGDFGYARITGYNYNVIIPSLANSIEIA